MPLVGRSVLRRQMLRLMGALAIVPVARVAFAQSYPVRPVRVIVTTGPGGQGDTTARLIAQKLTEALGQSFYIDNVPGAGGNIAMGTTARAAPDGYTLLAATSNIATNPSLFAKVPYDVHKDFAPVTLMCSSPHVLVVHPSVPARNVNELVALAKIEPGKYSFASAGRGTPAHLAGELFKLAFGVDITHVPFNGGGPATASTIGGHVPIAVSALPTAVTYVRAGNLRALGMMSNKRASALPEVPTIREAAGKDVAADIVNGLVAPAGTPPAVIDLLHREVVKVMALPDTHAQLASLGFEPVASTPAEFMEWIDTETVKWAKVIHDAQIGLQ